MNKLLKKALISTALVGIVLSTPAFAAPGTDDGQLRYLIDNDEGQLRYLVGDIAPAPIRLDVNGTFGSNKHDGQDNMTPLPIYLEGIPDPLVAPPVQTWSCE